MISRINIYKTPHFEYCPTIMYTNTKERNMLQRQQNRALRVILIGSRCTRVVDMLAFISMKQHLIVENLKFIHKIILNDTQMFDR